MRFLLTLLLLAAAVPVARAAPPRALAIASGGEHACAIVDGGVVRCWGGNWAGQLGPGPTTTQSAFPAEVPGLSARRLALGSAHSCALDPSGRVWCWGRGEAGALGDGRRSDSPRPVLALEGADDLAAGGDGTCALRKGELFCWGGGQLAAPLPVGATGVTAMALGDGYACVVVAGGKVRCIGENRAGQLGVPEPAATRAWVDVAGLDGVTALAAGGATTCALRKGAVLCWGDGKSAQTGDKDRRSGPTPHQVAGVDDAVRVAVGPDHACALRATGQVVCWGGSDRSSFGFPPGCPPDRVGSKLTSGPSGVMESYCAAPMPVAGIAGATELAHGRGHACVLVGTGVSCWGGLGRGELGPAQAASKRAVAIDLALPVLPAGKGGRAVALSAADTATCAVTDDGKLRCWGARQWGDRPLYDLERHADPREVPRIARAIDVSVGSYHTCAILSGGALACFGFNDYGALGAGDLAAHPEPVVVPGLTGVTSVATTRTSSGNHTCAATRDGKVYCWGANDHEQVARRAPTKVATPTLIPDVKGAIAVGVGEGASCAIDGRHVLRCWGTGKILEGMPREIARVVGFGLGAGRACVLGQDGRVSCWGRMLGNERPQPLAPIAGLPRARKLVVGRYDASVIADDGSVHSWWLEQADPPKQVEGITGARVLTCGGGHCCAIDRNGQTLCWGDNATGQLGDPAAGVGGERKQPGVVGL